MDSIGKTAGTGRSRQYFGEVRKILEQHHQIELDVLFHQGAGLTDLIFAALSKIESNQANEYDVILLLSFGNDLVSQAGYNVKEAQWPTHRDKLYASMQQFASRCRCR